MYSFKFLCKGALNFSAEGRGGHIAESATGDTAGGAVPEGCDGPSINHNQSQLHV